MGKGLPRSLSRAKGIVTPTKKLRISLNEAMTFTGSTGVAVFATAVIGDFEEGNVCILGAVSNLTFTGPTSANLADDFQGDYGIGSTATADATIGGTDANIIPSTAIPAATAEVSANVRAALAAPVTLDNTDGSLEVNLNVALDADEVTDGEEVVVTVTGTVDIVYAILGDD